MLFFSIQWDLYARGNKNPSPCADDAGGEDRPDDSPDEDDIELDDGDGQEQEQDKEVLRFSKHDRV